MEEYDEVYPCKIIVTKFGKIGHARWQNLIPSEYTLTEVDVPEGNELLKEIITFILPCWMTEVEAKENKAYVTHACYDRVSSKYC